jgi:hypothetical protein
VYASLHGWGSSGVSVEKRVEGRIRRKKEWASMTILKFKGVQFRKLGVAAGLDIPKFLDSF